MFCQKASRFLAWGNWPDIPITAMGCQERAAAGAGALVNRAALPLRQDFNFSPDRFPAILGGRAVCCNAGPFLDVIAGPAGAPYPLSRHSVPCLSASSFT